MSVDRASIASRASTGMRLCAPTDHVSARVRNTVSAASRSGLFMWLPPVRMKFSSNDGYLDDRRASDAIPRPRWHWANSLPRPAHASHREPRERRVAVGARRVFAFYCRSHHDLFEQSACPRASVLLAVAAVI